MCAVFGFLDYAHKIPYSKLLKLVRELSIAAEIRGTDATGISYVRKGEIVTFKKPKPAHKVRLYFPRNTTALIGHTRMTTQGDEKFNYNNHPFEGSTSKHKFALAHNGVLYDSAYIQKNRNLPLTHIETDSYVAVQLLEQSNQVNPSALKTMSETVSGSFVFTVVRDDNTLYIVKGYNPVEMIHVPEYGIYIYASTKDILLSALKSVKFKKEYEFIYINTGDIISVDKNGKLSSSKFDIVPEQEVYYARGLYQGTKYSTLYTEEKRLEDIYSVCNYFGVSDEVVDLLLDYGYTSDEIEDMLMDEQFLDDTLTYIRHSDCVH